jgi:ketosteroid isomerase-like protein
MTLTASAPGQCRTYLNAGVLRGGVEHLPQLDQVTLGRSMHARVAHVWRLAGGKIVAFEQFTDTLLVAKAMET